MKRKIWILFTVSAIGFGCKSPARRWLDQLATFRETSGAMLTIRVMKMQAIPGDTSTFSYQVRISPSKSWLENNGQSQNINFFYHMDSCFSVLSGSRRFPPAILQPVSNGLSGCYEYLLSFNLEPAIKGHNVKLVYQDKFIDGKKYSLQLNGN